MIHGEGRGDERIFSIKMKSHNEVCAEMILLAVCYLSDLGTEG